MCKRNGERRPRACTRAPGRDTGARAVVTQIVDEYLARTRLLRDACGVAVGGALLHRRGQCFGEALCVIPSCATLDGDDHMQPLATRRLHKRREAELRESVAQ